MACRLLRTPSCVGVVDELPWLKRQVRLTFARAGIIDPLSLSDYRATGGLAGLARARQLTPQAIIDEVVASGLRGRGGAAFPAGIKWQTVHDTPAEQRYVVCNADEGDSGTFADRLLIEADPMQLIEGMAIAARAVGATRGFIYLRSEYPLAATILRQAMDMAREAAACWARRSASSCAWGLAPTSAARRRRCWRASRASAAWCARSRRCRQRLACWAKPTVVNNVLTFAAVTDVLAKGGAAYASHGLDRSRGTMPFQLGGNVMRGGLVEVPFGITLRTLVEEFGGGCFSGRPMKAIQVGGPLGAYLPESQWDTPLAYESMAGVGAMLGHGGVVVFDDTVDMGAQAEFAMAFCAHESCGKCTPCRIGSTRGTEVIARLRRGEDTRANWALLGELCETMELGSLCALGGLTPMPVRSIMRHFTGDLMTGATEPALAGGQT